jgi:hypothetical protein
MIKYRSNLEPFNSFFPFQFIVHCFSSFQILVCAENILYMYSSDLILKEIDSDCTVFQSFLKISQCTYRCDFAI